MFYDPRNANYELTISPLWCNLSTANLTSPTCGDYVKIVNKRRDGFVVDAPVKLTINQITIDLIDSILPSSTPCLNLNKTCCYVGSDHAIHNADPTDNLTNCPLAFANLQLS